MKLLLVDDEERALRFLERILSRLYPEAEIKTTSSSKTALEYGAEDIDVAFLDVEMPGMTGLELGENLQRMHDNRLNIIYVTAYEEFAKDAYRIHASGYLTKPYDREEIQNEMENLRYPIQRSTEQKEALRDPFSQSTGSYTAGGPSSGKKLYIRCFGNFEVFYENQPIHFERTDAKEILAYLVNLRGSSANRMEICTALWEDAGIIERRRAYFRTLILSLRKTLEKYESEDLLITRRDSYAVNLEKFDCDYYRYLNQEPGSKDSFRGEYMNQYSWGEITLGRLMGE